MRLEGDLSSIKNPGEFVEIKLDGYYLRRPISVCDFSKDTLTLLYKVLGHGTKDMSTYKEGLKLDVLVTLIRSATFISSIKTILYNFASLK